MLKSVVRTVITVLRQAVVFTRIHRVHGPVQHFVICCYDEGLLATFPTPKQEDHPLSLARKSFKLSKGHVIMTTDPFNNVNLIINTRKGYGLDDSFRVPVKASWMFPFTTTSTGDCRVSQSTSLDARGSSLGRQSAEMRGWKFTPSISAAINHVCSYKPLWCVAYTHGPLIIYTISLPVCVALTSDISAKLCLSSSKC